MLALLGKIAALYAQNTNAPVALSAVDQIEDLTSMLSQKIAQKILILHTGAQLNISDSLNIGDILAKQLRILYKHVRNGQDF